MTATLRDRLLTLVAGAAASSPLLCAVAQADPVFGVSVSGRTEYSTNPFLTSVGDAGAARADISASPYVEINSKLSQARLSATLSHSEYSRLYDPTTDYGLQLNFSRTLSSRANLRGGAAFDSSATGNYRPEEVGITGVPSVLPNPTDITLVGFQDRRNQFRGSLGLGYTADSRNSISIDYSAVIVRAPDAPLLNGVRQGEYSSISQNVGYRRVINSRLSLGVSAGVNRINYFATTLGDATIITPNVNASYRVSGRWNISGSIGMSILRQTTIFGRDTSRNLSASLSACRSGTRDQFCFSGSREVSPSSLGAARKTISLGASYQFRLSARDTLNYSGNYVQSNEAFLGPIAKVKFISGGMGFKRQFNNRFALDIGAGFNTTRYQSSRSEARASIGISYILDNRR
jgi:hypothetical protein